MKSRSAIVVSASSDIGTAISLEWRARGWAVHGTYRTRSKAVDNLEAMGIRLSHCDLLDPVSIRDACFSLKKDCPRWDVLVMCPGTLDPIGAFEEVNFDEWEESLTANFSGQMRVVHELLPSRRTGSSPEPCVLFFAGGGTNSAP